MSAAWALEFTCIKTVWQFSNQYDSDSASFIENLTTEMVFAVPTQPCQCQVVFLCSTSQGSGNGTKHYILEPARPSPYLWDKSHVDQDVCCWCYRCFHCTDHDHYLTLLHFCSHSIVWFVWLVFFMNLYKELGWYHLVILYRNLCSNENICPVVILILCIASRKQQKAVEIWKVMGKGIRTLMQCSETLKKKCFRVLKDSLSTHGNVIVYLAKTQDR